MPTASLRLALLATAFALPGVLLAQAPAPAASPAPSASAPPKGPSVPKASKSAAPATPAAGAAASAPAGGAAPSGGGKRYKSSGNAQGAAAGATGPAGGAPAKSARSKDENAPQKVVGMQRAFADLQTTSEFEAYRDKAQAVKTVGECRTLMEETKKQLEPRAKAQNKPINVDIDKACATAKERKGLTG